VNDEWLEGTELKIDLTEADVLLVMRALTQLQPEHNGESIQQWTLIETIAKLLPPGSARTWRA
jgi:hypothetical protein